jgi:ADP-ribose pyrophosphatase
MSEPKMTVEEQAAAEQSAQVESQTIYEGRKFDLRVDNIKLKDGKSYRREIIVHPGAVVMIPVDSQGRLILIKQWRRAANRILIELPAGTLEKGEPPLECAKRELQEEIGYAADKMTPLGGFFSAPGICTEYLHLFLAEELRESRLDADEHEFIELLPATAEEAVQMIERGEIQDAKSIAGITRYYLRTKMGIS